MQAERGDVVRSLDPFKTGSGRQRPRLVVNTDAHPFGGEQFIGVASTTTGHLSAHPVRDAHWIEGGTRVVDETVGYLR